MNRSTTIRTLCIIASITLASPAVCMGNKNIEKEKSFWCLEKTNGIKKRINEVDLLYKEAKKTSNIKKKNDWINNAISWNDGELKDLETCQKICNLEEHFGKCSGNCFLEMKPLLLSKLSKLKKTKFNLELQLKQQKNTINNFLK